MSEVYFENLFNAVVEKAAEDYTKALCDLRNARGPKDIQFYSNELAVIEKFFHNGVECYTKLDGEMLLERLNARAMAYNYDWDAIKRSKNRA